MSNIYTKASLGSDAFHTLNIKLGLKRCGIPTRFAFEPRSSTGFDYRVSSISAFRLFLMLVAILLTNGLQQYSLNGILYI